MNKRAKVFFLAPVSPDAPLTSSGLGLVQAIERRGLKAGYIKPIAQHSGSHDGPCSVHCAKTFFNIPVPEPIALVNLEDALCKNDITPLLEEVVALLEPLQQNYDVVFVEGLLPNNKSAIDFHDVNRQIARGLAADYILVAHAPQNITETELLKNLELARSQFEGTSREKVIGLIVSSLGDQTDPVSFDRNKVTKQFPLFGYVPSNSQFSCSCDQKTEKAECTQDLLKFVADHISTDSLIEKIKETVELRMPPPIFRKMLIESARAANKRIVLPEGDEPRTLKAAAICQEKKIAHCILVGNPENIRNVAKAEGITLPSDIEIIDQEKVRDTYVAPMVELRKSKGMTPEQAAKELEDSVVLGTMMLATGDVDGLVSGAVHTTASTVRPALQLIKTAPGNTVVSSVFFMLMPDQVFAYGDCAINPNPTAEQLAEIACQSADSAKAFGITPRVAMISYSTGSSGAGPDVDLVKAATDIVREKRPDILVEGPIQYDAATVPSVGKQKAPNSPVAGQANVFVFPDLNTGNTTYKAVQRSANVVSVGPMLQGLRKPVNDLSRGALVEDIVFTIALTAIQAGSQKKN